MERITPLARELAEMNGIDWQQLEGSGDGGQITDLDIVNYLTRIMSGEEEPPSTPVDAPPPEWTGTELPPGGGLLAPGMPSMDMLSSAGVDSDLAALVGQPAPAAPVMPAPEPGLTGMSPAGMSLEDEAMEFELEDEPEVAAPVPAPEVLPPLPEPAPFVAASEPEPTAATAALPPMSVPLPEMPVPAPSERVIPEPAAPVAPAAAAPTGGVMGGLGGLLSRLYQKPSQDTTQATPPAAPPAAPTAPEPVQSTPEPVPAFTVPRVPEFGASAPAAPIPSPAAEIAPPAPAPAAPEVVPVTLPELPVPEVAAATLPEPVHMEPAQPEPAEIQPLPQPEVLLDGLPEVQPEVQPDVLPVAAPVPAAPAATLPPREAVWFGPYLRRDGNVAPTLELCRQLAGALGQDVPLALLVARAAHRHAETLGVGTVGIYRVGGEQARPAVPGSLREALTALDGDIAGTPDLLVTDAGALDLDELHLPHTLTLSVGRVQEGRAALTLNGPVDPAQGARFLASVAATLEEPIILVI